LAFSIVGTVFLLLVFLIVLRCYRLRREAAMQYHHS